MSKTNLHVSYSVNGRREKRLKLTSSSGPFVFGASNKAQVVLNGGEISPLHAAIEYRDNHWCVMDLSSESGTWINEEAVAEQIIEKPTTFRIGAHTIKLEPKKAPRKLYEKIDSQGKDFQEIVIRKAQAILDVALIEPKQAFKYLYGGKEHSLPAPKGDDVIRTQFGDIIILQRLVKAPPQLVDAHRPLGMNPRALKGFVLGLMGFALLIGLIMLFPKAPTEETQQENIYTKLILDKNVIQKERKKAMAVKQQMKVVEKSATASPSQDTRKQAQAAPKVITNIKASGLQQLLGKIASRTNSFNKNVIVSGGSVSGKGTATSVGKLTVSGVSGGVNAGLSQNIALAGIGTKGVGGGGSVSGLGTMNSGNIGQAEVGIVEEEADVEGGLDKDAIAAVIRANIGQIRYCYERKLTANPNLYGKVLVQFSIEGAGSVLKPKVSRTTLQDTDVEGCILRRLSQWKFPTPPAGTSVLVTYPFLFKSTQ